jgi:hypothetical protein
VLKSFRLSATASACTKRHVFRGINEESASAAADESASGTPFVSVIFQTASPRIGRLGAPYRNTPWEVVMKKILVATMLSVFTLSIIGCHASGEVGDNNKDTYSKKTTTVDPNGDRTIKTTEVKKTNP